jgi:murein DD-endopeptidase MepM/ murein hydrolase activator NlpD
VNREGGLAAILKEEVTTICPVVNFDGRYDRFLHFDFTGAAAGPPAGIIEDIPRFSEWINNRLGQENCRYGIGGYAENRVLYTARALFDDNEEARSLHLGTDIWAPAGTQVYTPLNATVHSFAFNDHYGDYGATLILRHEIRQSVFFTLYGHLSLQSILGIEEGTEINAGAEIGHFGKEEENGHWPPHLHFQLIMDMKGYTGDYPGVCKPSEREYWLANSPDPAIILKYTF